MHKKALLVMDVQGSIVERLADKAESYLALVQQAVDSAHEKQIPVIFVTVSFREGMLEISPRNKSFSSLKESQRPMSETDPATQPVLALQPGDLVVKKRRISAFSGSDLGVILRALDIQELVLCGISTSGVVLSTVREAADLDYQLTVLADGCYDPDSDVHTLLVEKIFPRQAEVTTIKEWIEA